MEPLRFVRQTDRQAIVVVRVPRTGEGLAFRFKIDPEEPTKLASIAVRGPVSLDADDDAIIRLTDQ